MTENVFSSLRSLFLESYQCGCRLVNNVCAWESSGVFEERLALIDDIIQHFYMKFDTNSLCETLVVSSGQQEV